MAGAKYCPKFVWAMLCLWTATCLFPLSAKPPKGPGPTQLKYLLIVDVSSSMAPYQESLAGAIATNIGNGFHGEMRAGDQFTVWTAGYSLSKDQYPATTWTPRNKESLAERLGWSLRHQLFGGTADLAAVLRDVAQFAARSDKLTVCILSDRFSPVSEIPFATSIDAICMQARAGGAAVLATTLLVKSGTFVGWSVDAVVNGPQPTPAPSALPAPAEQPPVVTVVTDQPAEPLAESAGSAIASSTPIPAVAPQADVAPARAEDPSTLFADSADGNDSTFDALFDLGLDIDPAAPEPSITAASTAGTEQQPEPALARAQLESSEPAAATAKSSIAGEGSRVVQESAPVELSDSAQPATIASAQLPVVKQPQEVPARTEAPEPPGVEPRTVTLSATPVTQRTGAPLLRASPPRVPERIQTQFSLAVPPMAFLIAGVGLLIGTAFGLYHLLSGRRHVVQEASFISRSVNSAQLSVRPVMPKTVSKALRTLCSEPDLTRSGAKMSSGNRVHPG